MNAQNITVENNYIKFTNLTSFEQFADNTLNKEDVSNLATSSSQVTTLKEANYVNTNDEIPEFFLSFLNQDYIFQISGFLVRFDFVTKQMYVLPATTTNAYATLLAATTSSTNVFNLDFDTDNGIEILEGIENGTIDITNYKSFIATHTTERRCPGAGPDKDPEAKFWAYETDFNECKGTSSYLADTKLVYQRVIIYFSIKAKIQSSWGCGKDPDFSSAPNYNAIIKIEGNAVYNPRCNGNVTKTINNTEGGVDKLVWNPYESIRSLRSYNVDVQ